MLPIRTERLLLRRFTLEDRARFLEYRRHPDVARYQSWDESYADADADEFFDEMTTAAEWRLGHWFQVAIERADDGRLLGDAAFWPDHDGGTVEIGYSLHPDAQGQGYASEAVTALIKALRDRGAHTVVAGCDPDNDASIRLLERLGFAFDGIVDGERTYRLAISGVATFGP